MSKPKAEYRIDEDGTVSPRPPKALTRLLHAAMDGIDDAIEHAATARQTLDNVRDAIDHLPVEEQTPLILKVQKADRILCDLHDALEDIGYRMDEPEERVRLLNAFADERRRRR